MGDDGAVLEEAAAHFDEHGYVVVPGLLSAEELTPAQSELGLMFPTAEEFHSGADPERNARFAQGAFAGVDPFPYPSVEWSLLGVSPTVVALAEALLGTAAIRLYEDHNWAKYGGATDYAQHLHRDFGNHTAVVPTDDPRFREVELFIYIHDVPLECGPTHIVSQVHTAALPIWPTFLNPDDHAEIYALEVAASGPAGTVVAYKTDTFHRGASITDPRGARFALKVSYRTISDIWIDRLGLTGRLGADWLRFVERATPRQLELTGFPPRGHAYWTEATWTGVCLRYPGVDLSAFRP
jgi:ectoine hydroxylase-related dioxygenase (phytanoyl-CoA dioxygenase family)